MIISASRRTDIPALYSEWFINRVKAGFVYVRNPFNYHQISKIRLTPDVVDGIVFWTKNPIPMLDKLPLSEKYVYYFQFTLNPYNKEIEPYLPDKSSVLMPAFKQLSEMIGKGRIIWRYDPIFISDYYSTEYHYQSFRKMAEQIAPYAAKCTISFMDNYRTTVRNTKSLGIHPPTQAQQSDLILNFLEISKQHNLNLDICAEEIDADKFDIGSAKCIDAERFNSIGNYILNVKKDRNQRLLCGCAESVDIGSYDTCVNNCVYCYANHNKCNIIKHIEMHDPHSPLLYGDVKSDDIIVERCVRSLKT